MSFLFLGKRQARSLSSDLRYSHHPFMKSRRAIFALYLGAGASLGTISLYQMGVLKHLPEPKLPKFNAERVNSSPEAYAILSAPDGVLGFASYAATMALVAMGASDRVERNPALPLVMAVKIGVDALNATRLAVDEWKNHRSFCSWCLLAVAATFAAVPLAIPESNEALKRLKKRR